MNQNYYDLTLGQRLLLYSQTFTVHRQINNIFILLLLEKKLDFAVLKDAVNYAYENNDAFRLRIKRVKGKTKQYFAESDKPEITFLDYGGKTKEYMDKQLHKYARRSFRIINRPMSKVFFIKSYDGTEGIYFGVSHMILDAWGIFVFFQFVMEAYEALKNGGHMPKALSPLEPLLQKELAYNESVQHQKDREFWQSEFERLTEPMMSHINGPSVLKKYRRKKRNPNLRYAGFSVLRTAARHKVLHITKEQAEKIKVYSEQNKISMQAAFMFGIRTAMSKLNDRQEDIGFYTSYARRSTLQEKRSGGTRAYANIFRNIMSEDMTFESACQDIFRQQLQIYRHEGCDTREVMQMEADAYKKKGYFTNWYSLLFTFQPVRLEVSGGTPIHTNWYCNGAFSMAVYLNIMDDDGTGALRCYYEYQNHTVKAQRISEFHSLMVNAVMAGVNNPSAAIGEILDSIDANSTESLDTSAADCEHSTNDDFSEDTDIWSVLKRQHNEIEADDKQVGVK